MDLNHPRAEEIGAILRGLEDAPALLAGLMADISEEEAGRVRGEGFWSIARHLAHLAEVQAMGADRFRRVLAEDGPEFVPYFPDKDEADLTVPPVAESLARFREGRKEILALLGSAKPADWDRTAAHPEYERYGLLILARHILMHDHWHMLRMEILWLTRDEYLEAQ